MVQINCRCPTRFSIRSPTFQHIKTICFFALQIQMFVIMPETPPYMLVTNFESLMKKLECDANKTVAWFKCNSMKLNPEKSRLICGHKYESMLANIGGQTIMESRQEKLLGVLLDSSINFKNHVRNLYKKAGSKLNELSCKCKILPFYKRRLLMNSFFSTLNLHTVPSYYTL